MTANGKRRYTYRPVPCPAFEIERMECWLTDLSDQGLMLAGKTVRLGLAKFERTAPRHMTYRADASPVHLTEAPPENEAVEWNARYGWEYAGQRGRFHYYRTAQAHPRELHTDPVVQAIPLRTMERCLWGRILCSLLLLMIFPLFRIKCSVLLAALTMGTPCFLLLAVLALCLVGDALPSIRRLRRLRRQLSSAGELEHRKNWRKGAAAYRVRSVLLPVAAAGAVALILGQAVWGPGKDSVPISDYDGPIPFSTAAELLDTELTPDSHAFSPSANRVCRWNDLLAPENITWCEDGAINASGETVDLIYSIEYHQMRNPLLARWLAKEYLRYRMAEDCVPLEAPPVEADVVYAYADGIGTPHLILVRDTRVVHVFLLSTGSKLTLDEWAQAFADGLA